MTIYSYVSRTAEQGGWTGVSRFDQSMRRVFDGLVSTTELPALNEGDVVITDNHLCLDVPDIIKTIVVHHGCAATHYDRDPQWRTRHTASLVEAQSRMYSFALNRIFVAPSQWVAGEFARQIFEYNPHVIPHWVGRIEPATKQKRPLITGDWRDNNKGIFTIRHLAQHCPQWDFIGLSFRDDADRREQYGKASLYLCLSLSEGGSYSMCDAEAAELPIVSTNVGNYLEFDDCEVIRWQDRDKWEIVAAAIERKLKVGRRKPSFYQNYDSSRYNALWREIVGI